MTQLDPQADGLYSIKVVARLTGLSPDTIRVWERRYLAVQPERTSGRTRRFSAQDVRRLALLRQATSKGHRIRHIARLSEEALRQLVDEAQEQPLQESAAPRSQSDPYAKLRQDYLDAALQLDALGASQLLLRAATLLDSQVFLFQVVLPLLRETGRRWEAGELAVGQEHLITAQLRGLLDTLFRFASLQPGAPKVVVTTPAGQRHELGAAMGALLAASRGYQVIYLGPDLPEEEILRVVERSGAELLVLGVLGTFAARELRALGATLQRLQERVEVWVGLPPAHPLATQAQGVRFFDCFEDYDAALTARPVRRRAPGARRG